MDAPHKGHQKAPAGYIQWESFLASAGKGTYGFSRGKTTSDIILVGGRDVFQGKMTQCSVKRPAVRVRWELEEYTLGALRKSGWQKHFCIFSGIVLQ